VRTLEHGARTTLRDRRNLTADEENSVVNHARETVRGAPFRHEKMSVADPRKLVTKLPPATIASGTSKRRAVALGERRGEEDEERQKTNRLNLLNQFGAAPRPLMRDEPFMLNGAGEAARSASGDARGESSRTICAAENGLPPMSDHLGSTAHPANQEPPTPTPSPPSEHQADVHVGETSTLPKWHEPQKGRRPPIVTTYGARFEQAGIGCRAG